MTNRITITRLTDAWRVDVNGRCALVTLSKRDAWRYAFERGENMLNASIRFA